MADPAPDDDPPPIAPVPPKAGDCCRRGCDPCIYEIYDEEVERYEEALRQWELRHRARY